MVNQAVEFGETMGKDVSSQADNPDLSIFWNERRESAMNVSWKHEDQI